MKQVHFLNGDALLDQFTESISGERLVMRECLIEGPVQGDSLDSFYRDRLEFLQFEYGATEEAYQTKTISQFKKLQVFLTTVRSIYGLNKICFVRPISGSSAIS